MNALGDQELSGRELMDAMRLADRNNFTKNYLNPALEAGLIERTIPDKPEAASRSTGDRRIASLLAFVSSQQPAAVFK